MLRQVNLVAQHSKVSISADNKKPNTFSHQVGVILYTVLAGLVSFMPKAKGQSPVAVPGTTFGLAIADGTAPFAQSGYYFFVASDSGNTYQLVNFTGTASSSGNYSYAANGAAGQLNLTDTIFDQLSADLMFTDPSFGSYTFTGAATDARQNGDFIFFNGPAPSSVLGKTFVCSLNDGAGNLASTGTAILKIADTGNSYTIQGDGLDVPDSSGTYSYLTINSATGKLVLNDSVAGNCAVFLAFTDAGGGSYGIQEDANNFQVGDFFVLDIDPPIVTITTPTDGQHVSNEVFSVAGTANDNDGVATVLYSLNGADWLEADTADNWNSWTANLVLNPGNNNFTIIALDNSGNLSATNSVTFYYVVSAILAIKTNGKGRVSPDYDAAILEVDAKYMLTAMPADGFAFVNWTDAYGNVATNQPTISFNMNPGLVYTANFKDISRPTIKIASPLNGQRLNSSILTVSGKANDNDQVSAVYCCLNNSSRSVASTGNGWSDWLAQIELIPGTNRLRAYSVDSAGNISDTNSVDFIYQDSSVLSVHTSGNGKIAPAMNGSRLRIGQRYIMSAIPAKGFAFTNWTDVNGNPLTNKPNISFQMVSNLDLTANFIDISKPVLTIAQKQPEFISYNEVVRINGRAIDNAAISKVYIKLNNESWREAASENNLADWWAELGLIPGTNYFYAYAVDGSGNLSLTNKLKIILPTALANLNGVTALLKADDGRVIEFTFGPKNFGSVATTTNGPSGLGIYTYTKLSASTGRLRITFTAPPLAASTDAKTYNINFSNLKSGRFTDSTTNMFGNVYFTNTPELNVNSLVRRTIYFINNLGQGKSTFFYSGKNYSTNLVNGEVTVGTTIAYTKSSPVTTLLKLTNRNEITYIMTRSLGTNYGTAYTERHLPNGAYLSSDVSFFGFGSQLIEGNAPSSLANLDLTIMSGDNSFKLAFGNESFSQQCRNSTYDNAVGNYAYTFADPNRVNLTLNYVAPTDIGGGNSSTLLSFFAPNLAYLVNWDNTVSAVLVGTASGFATGAAIGQSLSFTNADSSVNIFQLVNNGTFSGYGTWSSTGIYTYNNYGPETDMFELSFDSGQFSGDIGWLQINYTSVSSGSYKLSVFDGANNLVHSEQGNFGSP